MSESSAPREFRQIQFVAPSGSTELILVRHGESEAVREGEPVPLVDGHSDPALHDDGLIQAERVGARLAGERIDAVHPDGRVVVVTHGGVIGEILRQATDCRPFAFTGADNASISHVVVGPERWVVRRYNDTSHLESELTTAPEPLT